MEIPTRHIYRESTDGNHLLYAWFPSMHTRIDIIFSSLQNEKDLLHATAHIRDVLQQLEKVANFYDAESELASVNRTASRQPVKLSSSLYEMIAFCMEYHEKTFGCFDVTVHSENYNRETIYSVELSSEEHTVFFRQSGVCINLSGFLKGYALDRVKEVLIWHDIDNALINLGNSSVLARGNHPYGKGWKVDFGNPAFSAAGTPDTALQLYDECLTTSGNDSPGRKHIICPHTGMLVEGVRQVAVVTESGAIGEILSTSFFAADEERKALLVGRFPWGRII